MGCKQLNKRMELKLNELSNNHIALIITIWFFIGIIVGVTLN